MAKIIIKNLGPLQDCTVDIDRFTILTGAQASGKSTIAKSIYFCRTVKDDIYDLILKRALFGNDSTLFNDVIKILRGKFLQIFGTSKAMSNKMLLSYYFSDETYIRVTLRSQEGYDFISPNYVWIDFSKDIMDFLRGSTKLQEIEKDELKRSINLLFHDDCETVFIPAGRSLITLLTTQLNYLFTTMDDEQKRSIDFCTQKYIERILKIRPLFENGIEGLISQRRNIPGALFDRKAIDKMLVLMDKVLKGKYIFKNNEERLYIDEEHFVKINFTSSGQQETVWIFNILLYLLINNTKAFIIVEEPEAHLYPQAQKSIVEMLALIVNKSSSVMITTHSPYILGALNNLIYAAHVSENAVYSEQVNRLMEQIFYIKDKKAYFLESGMIQSCLEPETEGGMIINEVIDGASSEINELYDKLFDIEYGGRK